MMPAQTPAQTPVVQMEGGVKHESFADLMVDGVLVSTLPDSVNSHLEFEEEDAGDLFGKVRDAHGGDHW